MLFYLFICFSDEEEGEHIYREISEWNPFLKLDLCTNQRL